MPPDGVADIYLRTGPFVIHLRTSERRVLHSVALHYDGQRLTTPPQFADFHVSVERPGLRRWIRPTIEFRYDGIATSKPAPPRHGPAMFEWGLNWLIATTANQYLVAHAAVLERHGRALVLPGEPGAGKSTLAAGLAYRGWRLLSDELALIEPGSGAFIGLCRPVSLKNESIDIIRQFAPECIMGARMDGTLKGTIALMKPPAESLRRADELARPGWIISPRFTPGAPCSLRACSRAASFIALANHSLNYSVLGEVGFGMLGRVVEGSRCFDIVYGELDDAVRTLTDLADDGGKSSEPHESAP